MNTQPLISVVVPTCHRNDLLARCLDGLAPDTQSLPADEYEVLVTDDGSRSTAQEMVRELYPWAQWVEGPRQGPAANRNHGAARARGAWVAFTDDDCIPKAAWLQGYKSAIREGVDIYEGCTTCEAGIRSPLETAPLNLSGGYLWSCNMMVRREMFQGLGGFDTSFPAPCNEDVEFRERIKRQGKPFTFVADAVVDHPPRPQLRGVALGRRGESQVRLWYARGNRDPAGVGLLIHMLMARAQEIRWSPFGFGSLVWLTSAIIEVLYIAAHLHRWNLKHRGAYYDRAS